MVVAGFECDIDCCAGRTRARLAQRIKLGMRLAGLFVPAAPDNLSMLDDDTAHARVGGGRPKTFFGQA